MLYRNKMDDRDSAQELLREGWRQNRDAFNCLNNYFGNLDDAARIQKDMDTIYATETHERNKETFLQVLKHEFEKHPGLRSRAKEIAYEIISEQSQTNPALVSALQHFNKDKVLIKDILRFRNNNQKR